MAMEALLSSFADVVVTESNQGDRKVQRMEAAEEKAAAQFFWIFKPARAPSVARAPLLIFRCE